MPAAKPAQSTENSSVLSALDRAMATIEFDPKGKILTANEIFLERMGYTLDEVVGQHHRIFVEKDYAASQDYKQLWARLGKGEIESGEMARVAKDGSPVWIQAAYTPMLDEAGKVVKVVKFAFDITAKHEEAATLRNSIEKALDAVAMIDENNNVVFFNAAAEKLWGVKRDEVLGKNVNMLVPTDIREQHDELVNRNRRTGTDKVVGCNRDMEMERRDGSKVWINLSLSKVQLGERIFYTAFVKDITEQREARERINQTLAQSVDSVVSIDENNIITFFNAAAERMWGYKAEEVIGENVKMLVPEEIRGGHDELVNANRRTGVDKIVGTSRDLQLFKRDGTPVWANLALSKVRMGDKITYTAFVKDITEQKVQAIKQAGLVSAIDSSQAMIEFTPEGEILEANELFLETVGYTLPQIQGKHHRMFCDEALTKSDQYSRFWETLRSGEFISGEFKRVNKAGEEIWIQATYSPVTDDDGKVIRVVKLATEITAQRKKNAEYEAKVDAIGRSQAVIEFDPLGNVLKANDNFLRTLGYSLNEITGQHHKIFCSDEYVRSKEYTEFWHNLAAGAILHRPLSALQQAWPRGLDPSDLQPDHGC